MRQLTMSLTQLIMVPRTASGLRGSAMRARGAHAVHAWCVYWGDFVDLPTCSTVKCMRFQALKGFPIAHTALCPLTVSHMSPSWLPTGITVTYALRQPSLLKPVAPESAWPDANHCGGLPARTPRNVLEQTMGKRSFLGPLVTQCSRTAHTRRRR